MAKKPKLNFGEGDGHNFFARHVEKLILAAVAVLVAFFVYRGFSIEGIDSSKSPAHLRNQANNAKTKLDGTSWEAVMEEEGRTTDEIAKRLGDRGNVVLQATQDALYAGLAVWNPRPFRVKAKRGDPPVFAPEQVVLEPGYGPIAMNGITTDDQLLKVGRDALLAAQEKARKEAERKKKEEEKKNARVSGGEASMPEPTTDFSPYDSFGMGGDAAAGPALTPEQRAYHANLGYQPNSAGGSGMGDMSTMMMPTSGGGNPYSSGDGGGYGAGQSGVIPAGKHWITVMALVPYKKQWTEWELAFQDAHDYNPQRDIPQYFYYLVERVEVNEAGEDVKESQKYWRPEDATWYVQNWYAGVPDPIVDPAYFHPLLTNPCPPILERDLERYQLHPSGKTPKRKLVALEPVKVKRSTDSGPPSGAAGPGAVPRPSSRGPMAGGAGPYGAGASPYGSSGAYGGGSPYGASNNPYGGATDGAYDAGGAGEDPYGSGGDDPYSSQGYGMGMGMGMGMGSMMAGGDGPGYGMGMGGAPRLAAPAADYKLFRFTDFVVEPGKRYKYRVKLYLRDPNHPQAPMVGPSPAYLEEEVNDRIQNLDAEDAKKTQETGELHQTFWRETEWSEWSPAAEIPHQYKIAAGSVTPERSSLIGDKRIEIAEPGSEPQSSVLAMVFDQSKGADIPGLVSAARGTVLNFKAPANVLHPINMQVFPLSDYDFKTNVMVLDVRGGQTLPTNDKSTIDHKAPGEVLLMDSDGRLVVHNELDDVLVYTNNIFKEPEKPKVIETDDGTAGYPGVGPPGMGPPGRRGRGS